MPVSLLMRLLPAAIALALIALAFAAGYRYSDAQHEKEKAELIIKGQKDLQEEIDRKHKLALEYEKKIQDMAGKVRTVVRTIEVEVEKQVYKDCVVPQTGVSALNNAAKTLNETRDMEPVNKAIEKLNKDRSKK